MMINYSDKGIFPDSFQANHLHNSYSFSNELGTLIGFIVNLLASKLAGSQFIDLSLTLTNIYRPVYISSMVNPFLLHLQAKSDKKEMFYFLSLICLFSLLTSLAGVLIELLHNCMFSRPVT